ncbi:hypothetical protein [Mucilaginibacter koreensis]
MRIINTGCQPHCRFDRREKSSSGGKSVADRYGEEDFSLSLEMILV